MPRTDHDRVIAMAGLFQATGLVSTIARQGVADPQDLQTCLASLFKIDAGSSEEIYGGIANLKSGLLSLSEHLRKPVSLETSRYVVALLVLERKLSRLPDVLQTIRSGIEAIQTKLGNMPITNDEIVADLAEIYASNISDLTPRVMVYGEQIHLSNLQNANRIRALLLAGIRAAVLWNQSGGGRLTLLMRRRTLLLEAQRLLSSKL